MNIGCKCRKYKFIIIILNFIIFAGCSIAPVIGGAVNNKHIADGVYKGFYNNWPNKAIVEITIKENKIIDINLVKHSGSWIGKKVESIIPARIIKTQSTDVDAVSGATNSSRVIMNAVEKAIERSSEMQSHQD
jgi:uncharacterized protein with FMN-binding domain